MTPPTAASRLLCDDVLRATLADDGASAALRTAAAGLGSLGATEVGLWEAGPGSDVDVESDEVFLVLVGAGSITFDDGSVLLLRPGCSSFCKTATGQPGRSSNGSESCTSPDIL